MGTTPNFLPWNALPEGERQECLLEELGVQLGRKYMALCQQLATAVQEHGGEDLLSETGAIVVNYASHAQQWINAELTGAPIVINTAIQILEHYTREDTISTLFRKEGS